jgi:predicted DCC family thiol-disulfide oxidoreductase YuxK
MKSGWTGGQYSLYRGIFGAYLFIHFVSLIPWGTEMFSNRGVLPEASASPMIYLFPNALTVLDSPAGVLAMLGAAALLSLFFLFGFYDRAAAFGLWYVWACLYGRNPLISNPGLPYVGWLLLAHLFIPPRPYGSWAARGRPDPGGGWSLPQSIFGGAWILMSLGYSYSGYTKLISPSWLDGTALARVLENPLARPGFLRAAVLAMPDGLLRAGTWSALAFELGFAVFALFRPLRPWVWAAMLFMHLSLIVLIDFADLSFSMAVLHLFTFNPDWARLKKEEEPSTVFYDGSCGLCHGAVRFVLAEDPAGGRFRFAPLQGESFKERVEEGARLELPDSIVLRRPSGDLLVKSDAVLFIMKRLGGYWFLLGTAAGAVPRGLRDRVYDFVAAVRHRLFAKPSGACPLVPPPLRARFLP